MQNKREQVMTSLLNLIAGSADYKTVTRKLVMWDQVPSELRPWLCITEGHENNRGGERKTPVLTTIRVNVFIYVNTNGLEVPMSALNPLLDALDGALAPDDYITGGCTLGGLVDHTWIDGETLKIAGDFDGDGIIVAPVKILCP